MFENPSNLENSSSYCSIDKQNFKRIFNHIVPLINRILKEFLIRVGGGTLALILGFLVVL